MNNEHIRDNCRISSGMCGIRYSYSFSYYAIDGTVGRFTSGRSGSVTFNANSGRCFIHNCCQPSFFFLPIVGLREHIFKSGGDVYSVSASSKINDSTRHYMVLQAISRGLDTVHKIATATRKSENEVRDIINDLVNQRLANMRKKGRFFGSKETKFTITETGSSLLGVKHQELKQSQERLKQMYGSQDRQQLQTYMDSNRAWIPFMLLSGIIDALFFASILSFMRMAMNPSEQAAVDSAGTEGDAGGDTASGSDTSGMDRTAGDSGSADTSGTADTGGGDIGAGFDGGGFDF